MDPATIIQLIEGSLSLVLQCGHATKALNDIAARYKYANLSITSMSQGSDTIQMAWSQISEWFQNYESQSGVGTEFFLQRLQRSLENGILIMDALQGDLRPYQTNNLSFRQRSKAIWNENTLRGHQDRISHQVTAMTCLLQAIQLRSFQARDQLLKDVEPQLRRSDESACSIVPSRMSSRISKSSRSSACMEITEMAYRRLSFENDLFTACVYKRNYRNPAIDRLFKSRWSRSQRPMAGEAMTRIGTYSRVNSIAETSNTSERLQVQVQKEYANEKAKQNSQATFASLSVTQIDRTFSEACRNGQVELVRNWLKDKRNFAAQKLAHKVLLLEAMKNAVLSENLEVAQTLLEFEVPINNRPWWRGSESYGWLPLQFSVCRGDTAMTKLLLQAGAGVSPVDVGTQPLHIASHVGATDITSILLNFGAIVASIDSFGFQPLHIVSTYQDRSRQIELLAEAGASVEAENPLAPSWQKRPLQLACLTGQVSNVHSFIDLGATRNIGRSLLDAPLGIAIRRRHVPILQTLLRHGADPNYASKSKSRIKLNIGGPGMTPICLLAKYFGDTPEKAALDQAMLNLLIEHGASISRRDDEGNHVLHYMCGSKHSMNLDLKTRLDDQNLITTLLNIDEIDMNATNDHGECPLYLAALNFNFGLVDLLLSKGKGHLSGAERFRLQRISEVAEKKRPYMKDDIQAMMRKLILEN